MADAVDYGAALEELEKFWLEKGCPPTRRQLTRIWKVASTSTVTNRLKVMRSMRMVRMEHGRAVPRKLHERVKAMEVKA